MKGLRITNVRLNFYEDDFHSSAQVIVEWSHSMASAAAVLKLCGGIDMPPSSMLEAAGIDRKGLKTVRTFRFENREDALLAYDGFEEALRAQEKEKNVETVGGA